MHKKGLEEISKPFFVELNTQIIYLISCSKSLKNSELKKSPTVISNPSQIFFIVDIVVLLFLPQTILFNVD